MTVALWVTLGTLALWVLMGRAVRGISMRDSPASLRPVYPAPSCSDALLNSFFRESSNYADQPEDKVFLVVGRPAECDDWDWGRLVYYWSGSAIRVRAIMQGGVVICAELIEPGNDERFAEPVEVLWERPQPKDWGA